MNIKCNNCKSEKDISEFVKNRYKKNGILSICKICFREKYKQSKDKRRQYYQENKQKWTEYYIENKEEISEYKREYRKENIDHIREKNKQYVQENKEILKLKWKKYREENKDKISQWFEDNYEYRIEYRKEYSDRKEVKEKRNIDRKNRRLNDEVYKIKENIRCRIQGSLRSKKYRKNLKTESILGCTYEEFKHHLESKFEAWMSWSNYGLYNGDLNYGWDIDHIIPLSSATSEEEVLKLNHFTNLQPLCSKVNRDIKSSKMV